MVQSHNVIVYDDTMIWCLHVNLLSREYINILIKMIKIGNRELEVLSLKISNASLNFIQKLILCNEWHSFWEVWDGGDVAVGETFVLFYEQHEVQLIIIIKQ